MPHGAEERAQKVLHTSFTSQYDPKWPFIFKISKQIWGLNAGCWLNPANLFLFAWVSPRALIRSLVAGDQKLPSAPGSAETETHFQSLPEPHPQARPSLSSHVGLGCVLLPYLLRMAAVPVEVCLAPKEIKSGPKPTALSRSGGF